ncbi:3-mercaptopyruvate sulfurtransferase [soil metagenome]
MEPLVSTQWLADEMGADDLHIVDATYFLPEAGRDAIAEYASVHVPGALYMDLTGLVDTASPFANTIPSAEKFANSMQALGIGDDDRVVVYDNSPHRTATRGWWLFRLFGAQKVAVLDGGLPKWTAEGRPTESGIPAAGPRPFTARKDDAVVRTTAQILAALDDDSAQIVDARSISRFTGEEQETRPGLASGHIPGALSLPYTRLFNADGTWKRGEELKAAFIDAGVDLDRPVITTCGSGVTAASLFFGAVLLGKTDLSLYDGSWSEWGADPALPKATGPA